MTTGTPSRNKRFAVHFTALLLCLLPLYTAGSVRAMDLYSYDLDSLVYMSSDIVEGELVRNYTEYNVESAEIKVTAAFMGAFTPGQSVAVTALDFYRIQDEKMNLNSNKLQIGDKFFIFLTKAKKTFLYDIPEDAEIYWTAPSGLKLILDDKVIGFSQIENPGPYVSPTPKFEPKTPYPTPEEYRAQIQASIIKKMALWGFLWVPTQ